MLLLFDIDGTLVRTAGAGRHALNRAIEETHGIPDALNQVRLDGNTDPQILTEVFHQHLGRSPTEPEMAQIQAAYLRYLPGSLEARAAEYQVLPGVQECLDQVMGTYNLGLCTGNIEAGARLKLQPGDLERHFPFGGFGSDGAERAHLVRCAIERGEAHAGRRFPPDQVVVIGDTERDVAAARTVGAWVVGVSVGCSDRDRLVRSQPDLLLEQVGGRDFLEWLRGVA